MPKVLAIPGCSNLTASLCHCYSYAFKGVTGPRPRLDPEEVLNWVRDKARPEVEPTDDYRSLQLSYLYSQFTVAEHPERAVTTAHYLFLITAARVHGCGIAEVSERLPQLLGRGSALEKFFASYNRIPALFEIYQDCRALWESFAK
jgi:hypothetical protein